MVARDGHRRCRVGPVEGAGDRVDLIKGNNRPQDKLLPPPTIDAKRQIKGAPQAELYRPNVNRVKDMTDTRLKIADGGGGSITFPCDTVPRRRGEAQPALVAAPWIAEMRAEENIDGQWTRPDHRANETLDLYVYAFTVVLRFADGDASMAWVPEWARPPRGAPRKLAAPIAAPAEDRDHDDPPREMPTAAPAPTVPRGPGPRRGGPNRSVRVHRAR
jgi:phage terminase large subunit GpA-like protein